MITYDWGGAVTGAWPAISGSRRLAHYSTPRIPAASCGAADQSAAVRQPVQRIFCMTDAPEHWPKTAGSTYQITRTDGSMPHGDARASATYYREHWDLGVRGCSQLLVPPDQRQRR